MVRYVTMDISPELAARILESNYDGNRNVNARFVNTLAKDMESGRFVSQNGQTITITDGGTLLDGQHRLSAIVQSGVTLPFLVCIIPDDKAESAFRTMDSGVARKAAQFVNVPQANKVVALARVAYTIENGRLPLSGTLRGILDGSGKNAVRPSRIALVEYIEEHSDHLLDVVRVGSTTREVTPHLSTTGVFSAIELLFYLHQDGAVREFVADVCSLQPKKKVSAALVRKLAAITIRGAQGIVETTFAFLYAYDKWRSNEDSSRITSLSNTEQSYNSLLELQRAIRRSDDAR